MPILHSVAFMPTKLRYKLAVAFALMSVLPMLAGVYVASLLIKLPLDKNPQNMATLSLVLLVSFTLALLGYRITHQMVMPLVKAADLARNIAQGKHAMAQPTGAEGSEELEDLSRSLNEISRNARQLLEKVEKLSQKDKLTGLYTVSYIRERLKEEIERAAHNERPCSFVYLIINGFDVYAVQAGQAASEETLKAIAQTLSKHLTEYDRAAHISRDEFALIFPGKNKKKTIELAQEIISEIKKMPFMLESQRYGFDAGLSVGVSENPIDGATSDDLYIKAVDRATAMKSKGGGTGVESFH